MDSSAQSWLTPVERELLEHIIEGLKNRSLAPEEAQTLAKEFLAALPVADKSELLQKLNALGQKYDPAQATYLTLSRSVQDEERDKKLHEMSQHIKSGNIESALAVVKGAK